MGLADQRSHASTFECVRLCSEGKINIFMLFQYFFFLNVVSFQFAFPFVECHRVKECHVKACDKSGYPVQGSDGPLLDTYQGSRNPKDSSVGTWNVDGEILRQHSLSVRFVHLDCSQFSS